MSALVESGRELYQHRAWASAYQSLSLADQAQSLGGDDLELLAMSAYLVGRDEDYLSVLERAWQAHLDADRRLRAAHCAFWLGLRFQFRGESGRSSGWFARAQRLLEYEEQDCAERGYMLLPLIERHLTAGDLEAAYAAASDAADIGERCGAPDLVACARLLQGRVRILEGRVTDGLALLDEAMIAVAAGDLSPMVTGLIYCAVIESCQEVYALGRAHEWTSALAQWCDVQPEMVAFTGICRVHRAELLQLLGRWPEAAEEVRRARERCEGVNRQGTAAALYQQAELHRLRGELAAAEEAYRRSGQLGPEPQPGLALLRLAQGRSKAATAAIRRAVSATAGRLQRLRLLPAAVEIMLAVGELDEARNAWRELEGLAESLDTSVPDAMAAQARGAVELAEGNAGAALGSLRQALELWLRLEAPYPAACVRVLLAKACWALGDADGGRLEVETACATFERLGAALDLARIESLSRLGAPPPGHRLTRRELQVLRLVAAGKTNRAIAAELFLSEKTIDRHVSNIFTKLDVRSRAAATAYAYRHELI